MSLSNSSFRLSLVLWIATIQSILIGLCLIAFPASWMAALGLQVGGDRFFQVQVAAFQFVMAAAYTWAALKLFSVRELIILAILAKSIAAVFLLTYCLVVQMIWVVLAAAAIEALMAALIHHTLADCEKERVQRLGHVTPQP